MEAYAPGMERMMRRLYRSLRESDRRRYAAVEAAKLGHGGVEYIADLLGCDPKTIRQGVAELEGAGRARPRAHPQKRGGRKRVIDQDSPLTANFLQVLRDHTAGDPMNADVKWTNLSRRQIARRLKEMGTPVSRRIVSQLLRRHGSRLRQSPACFRPLTFGR